jgi:hypothetical protein
MIGKRKLMFKKEELKAHLSEYVDDLKEQGLTDDQIDKRLGAYYTDRIIKKYSREEQDKFMAEIYHTILEIPGGYWQIIKNMDYMPEFEHDLMKSHMSYEKGNVSCRITNMEKPKHL